MSTPLQPVLRAAGFDRSHVLDDLDIASLRRAVAELAYDASLAGETRPDAGAVTTVDGTVAGPGGSIHTRAYRPSGSVPARAVIVWAHGGGFVAGSIVSHDAFARELAQRTRCEVVLYEYRLAPEHPFPAAADDTAAVLGHVFASARAGPVLVGGDSAGAVLAFGGAADADAAVAGCMLLYPMLDDRGSDEYESYGELGESVLLGERAVRRFWRAYLPPDTPPERAAPARRESIAGFPPTLAVVAHLDVLRDEAYRFCARLADSGVDVGLWVERDAVHGFLGVTGFEAAARRTFEAIGRFVDRISGVSPR